MEIEETNDTEKCKQSPEFRTGQRRVMVNKIRKVNCRLSLEYLYVGNGETMKYFEKGTETLRVIYQKN